MRDNAVLINSSRVSIVDGNTLQKCLLSRRLTTTCVDVFVAEPPTNDGVLNAPALFCTLHMAGSTKEARLAIGKAAIEGIENKFFPDPDILPFV